MINLNSNYISCYDMDSETLYCMFCFWFFNKFFSDAALESSELQWTQPLIVYIFAKFLTDRDEPVELEGEQQVEPIRREYEVCVLHFVFDVLSLCKTMLCFFIFLCFMFSCFRDFCSRVCSIIFVQQVIKFKAMKKG